MSRLVARLILSMLLLPVAMAVFVLLFFFVVARAAGPGPPPAPYLLFVWCVEYALIAVYWYLLWREHVNWSPARVRRTLLLIPAALLPGVLIGVAVFTLSHQASLGVLIGGGPPPIIAVLGSVLIWRETPAERLERVARAGRGTVACPLCGYNLTGLSEARCPECGGKFTLEDLLSSQPAREVQELEA